MSVILSNAKGLIGAAVVMVLLSVVHSAPSTAQTTLNIAAVVNDDVITVYDLSSRINLAIVSANMPASKENRQRLAPQVLRTLINERLQVQEAKAIGVEVTELELESALTDIEARNRIPKGTLQQSLERKGVDFQSLREQVTATISWMKVKRRMAGREVKVTEDEVNAVIERIQANQGKPERRVAEIFLSVDTPSQQQAVKSRAEQLVFQIRNGGNFPSLARQFSQGPSAATGGDLGWMRPGQLPREVETMLDRLGKGAVSDPFQDNRGFHVYTIIAQRTSEAVPMREEKVQLYQVVVPIPAVMGSAEKTSLKAASDRTASEAASCADMKKFGEQSGSSLSGNLGTLKLNDLPAELRAIVAPLVPRKSSEAVDTENGVMYLMVCRRSGGAKASLPAMRLRVTQMLTAKRAESLAQKRLFDLRQSAILDVRL